MSEEERSINVKSVELPKLFYSDVTGQPLKNCVMCGKHLLDKGTPYVIEKAFRLNKKFNTRDTLFEYAICYECYEKMSHSLSMESMLRLESYFRNSAYFIERSTKLITGEDKAVDHWLDKCAIKGTDIKDCAEYQVCCQCDGTDMLLSHLPIAISEEALLEINEQLSTQTKDELDRFQDDFLGLPPDLKELFKDRSLIVV